MTTNGNPSVAAALLIKQLVTAGARVRYHGDFDAAGLVICARLAALGAIPWRMTVHHYRAALVEAEHEGVSLPLDPTAAPPTPWDPPLQQAFDAAGVTYNITNAQGDPVQQATQADAAITNGASADTDFSQSTARRTIELWAS